MDERTGSRFNSMDLGMLNLDTLDSRNTSQQK